MSDRLADRLSRFTPNSAGLDRGALLFAAGQASVRPARRWQVVAALLAVTQLVTLALLLRPRTESPAIAPISTSVLPAETPVYTAPEPSALAKLNRQFLEPEREVRSEPLIDAIPPVPPLRAFDTSAAQRVD